MSHKPNDDDEDDYKGADYDASEVAKAREEAKKRKVPQVPCNDGFITFNVETADN